MITLPSDLEAIMLSNERNPTLRVWMWDAINDYTVSRTVSGIVSTTNTISSLVSTSTVATLTTVAAHGFSTGDYVDISGVTPSGYNGHVQITSVPSTTQFTYTVVGGLTTPATITTATLSAIATVTTTTAHGFLRGDYVDISGATPSGYNGHLLINGVPNSTSFTYIIPAPLASATGTILLSRTRTDTITEIVMGTSLQTPYDVTSMVKRVNISDNMGLVSSSASVVLTDDTYSLHPDFGANSKYLQNYQVVTIDISDIKATSWVRKFVGYISGQPSYTETREAIPQVAINLQDRLFVLNNAKFSTKQYVANSRMVDVLNDFARTYLGMTTGEYEFLDNGKVLGMPVQFIDESPTIVLSKCLEVVNKIPKFRGNGILREYDLNIVNRASNREYTDDSQWITVSIPGSSYNPSNRIIVTGLDSLLTEVIHPKVVLATADVHFSAFQGQYSLPLKWSPDGTKRAKNISVSGGGDTWIHATLNNATEFGATLYVQNDHANENIGKLIAAYAIYQAGIAIIGGSTVVTGGGSWLGEAPLATAFNAAVNTIFSQQYNPSYTVVGDLFELCHTEIRSEVIEDGIPLWREKVLQIDNQMINSQVEADMIAEREYFRELVKAKPRNLTMLYDLAIEPCDMITLVDGRRYVVNSVQYNFERGVSSNMSLNCFMVN